VILQSTDEFAKTCEKLRDQDRDFLWGVFDLPNIALGPKLSHKCMARRTSRHVPREHDENSCSRGTWIMWMLQQRSSFIYDMTHNWTTVYKAESAIKLELLNKTFSILQTYDKMYKYVHKTWHTATFCTKIHMLHHISKHVGPGPVFEKLQANVAWVRSRPGPCTACSQHMWHSKWHKAGDWVMLNSSHKVAKL